MARKTEFELETKVGPEIQVVPHFKISIIGKRPENNPYVVIDINQRYYFIQDRDLSRILPLLCTGHPFQYCPLF